MICLERLFSYCGYGILAKNMQEYCEDHNIHFCHNSQTIHNPKFGNRSFSYDLLPSADRVTGYPEDFPHLTVSIPFKFKRYGNKKHILYTTTESKCFTNEKFRNKCNSADEIWTISYSCKQTLEQMGVKKPIEVIYPIVPKRLSKQKINIENAKSYKFLFLNSWQEKKGIKELLEAYMKAFDKNDDVSCIIKTSISKPKYIFNKYNKIARENKVKKEDLPHLLVINESLSEQKKSQLYNTVDAFVSPYRMGGFELSVAEARAQSLPVITTDWLPEILDDTMDVIELDGLERVSNTQVKAIPLYEGSFWGNTGDDFVTTLSDYMRFYYEDDIHSAPISNRFSENVKLLAHMSNLMYN